MFNLFKKKTTEEVVEETLSKLKEEPPVETVKVYNLYIVMKNKDRLIFPYTDIKMRDKAIEEIQDSLSDRSIFIQIRDETDDIFVLKTEDFSYFYVTYGEKTV